MRGVWIICVLFCCGMAADSKAERFDSDEIAVYRAVLSGTGFVRLLPFVESSKADAKSVAIPMSGEEFVRRRDHVRNNLPGIDKDLAAAYVKYRPVPVALDPELPLGVKLVQLSRKTTESIFGNSEGASDAQEKRNWAALAKRFPNYIVTEVWRVVFDGSKTQALVSIAEYSDMFGNESILFYLNKIDGKWTVTKNGLLWAD
jgi:hypothetical protein